MDKIPSLTYALGKDAEIPDFAASTPTGGLVYLYKKDKAVILTFEGLTRGMGQFLG